MNLWAPLAAMAIVLGASCTAAPSTSAPVDGSEGSSPAAAATRIVAEDAALVVTVTLPERARSGELVQAAFTIENRSDEPQTVRGGECPGPVLIRAVSPGGSLWSFRDGDGSGTCLDQFELSTIEPSSTLRGSAVWEAGRFEGPAPLRDVTVGLTVELTRVDGDAQHVLEGSDRIEVLAASR